MATKRSTMKGVGFIYAKFITKRFEVLNNLCVFIRILILLKLKMTKKQKIKIFFFFKKTKQVVCRILMLSTTPFRCNN